MKIKLNLIPVIITGLAITFTATITLVLAQDVETADSGATLNSEARRTPMASQPCEADTRESAIQVDSSGAACAWCAYRAPWAGLRGVPDGFADGEDNDTTYSAGNQLELVDTTFNVTEGADSGLDADLLDGQDASAFASVAHDHLGQTWTGDDGPLVISGTFGPPDNAPLALLNEYQGGDGLRVESESGNGIWVGKAAASGVAVHSAGVYGVNIVKSDWDGVWVNDAAASGVAVGSAGIYGMHVITSGGDGVNVASAASNGVSVAGNNLAGYFAGAIQVTGGCTGCTLTTFGVNVGRHALAPGDVVAIRGIEPSGVDSVPVIWNIAPVENGEAAVGVVQGRAELVTDEHPRPNEIGLRLVPRDGPAQPGGYVTIVIFGPAQVKAGPADGPVRVGARLTVGPAGRVRALKIVEVEGVRLAENAPTLGIALEEVTKDGLIWVLVNPH